MVKANGSSFALQYKRTTSRPIDSSESFLTLKEAEAYARNTDEEAYFPYLLQIIAVEEEQKLYILVRDPDISTADNRKHFKLSFLGTERDLSDRFVSKLNDDTVAGLLTLLQGLISKGLIEANGGLVVRKQELTEASLLSLIEENEDALVEELSSLPPGIATTLGELTNVSDEADNTSETNDILVRIAGSSDWTIDSALLSNVSQLMSKVFPFTMTLSGGGNYEKGSLQTISLSWTYDRDIESQSLNNEALLVGIRSKQYTGVSTDTIYTLNAIQGGQMYTKSVSAQFKLKKYYGVSANGTLTNDEILALSGTWAGRTQGSTAFDCTGGKYPYYILPTSMVSGIQFWISGLRNTDWHEEVMNVTNEYGYTENYTIFRLNSIQTGVLNIEVR